MNFFLLSFFISFSLNLFSFPPSRRSSLQCLKGLFTHFSKGNCASRPRRCTVKSTMTATGMENQLNDDSSNVVPNHYFSRPGTAGARTFSRRRRTTPPPPATSQRKYTRNLPELKSHILPASSHYYYFPRKKGLLSLFFFYRC